MVIFTSIPCKRIPNANESNSNTQNSNEYRTNRIFVAALLDRYTNVQAMNVCMVANSSSVCFSQGCFLGCVRRPRVFGWSLIGSDEKPLACKLPHN